MQFHARLMRLETIWKHVGQRSVMARPTLFAWGRAIAPT